jgi:hypothetical protein
LRLFLLEEGMFGRKGVRESLPRVYRVFPQLFQGSIRMSVMMLPRLNHINSVGDPLSFSVIQPESFDIGHVVSLVFHCLSAIFNFREVFGEEGNNIFMGWESKRFGGFLGIFQVCLRSYGSDAFTFQYRYKGLGI